MHIFAIGDLHLGLARGKNMDVFGENWRNHWEKIKKNWLEQIQPEDIILLPGDISWAMNMKEVKPDLDALQQLPGKKILTLGNHDYWWSSTSKCEKAYPDFVFLKNRAVFCGDLWICATRGWTCPNDTRFTAEDDKIYQREQMRLRLSLEDAMKNGANKILLMLHFPPANDKKEISGFLELIESYPVETVVYGHLHGTQAFAGALEGEYNGVTYHLVSSDYLDFVPKKIL